MRCGQPRPMLPCRLREAERVARAGIWLGYRSDGARRRRSADPLLVGTLRDVPARTYCFSTPLRATGPGAAGARHRGGSAHHLLPGLKRDTGPDDTPLEPKSITRASACAPAGHGKLACPTSGTTNYFQTDSQRRCGWTCRGWTPVARLAPHRAPPGRVRRLNLLPGKHPRLLVALVVYRQLWDHIV